MPNYANMDALNKYYEALAAPINANIKQAENDYNTNMANLKNQYDTSLNTSKANRAAELEALLKGKETADAQAYRALQRQLKTAPDEMSALGAQGGMVDSGLSFIKNRYLQGRNDRDTQLAANNADVGRRYDEADANLLLGYNTDSANYGRDYQNLLEGYRGQLAQFEQQAAADRAELEYQQALAAAAAAGGGGGSSRRSSSRRRTNGSGSNSYYEAEPVYEDTGDSFSSNYGNYKVLPTTAQMMLNSTTEALRNGGNKTAATNNNAGSFASNYGNYKTIGSSSLTSPVLSANNTTQKKTSSNLKSLKR